MVSTPIFGTVFESGTGVSGATVYAVDVTGGVLEGVTTTDANGEYSLVGLDSAKEYHLAAEYDDGTTTYNAPSKEARTVGDVVNFDLQTYTPPAGQPGSVTVDMELVDTENRFLIKTKADVEELASNAGGTYSVADLSEDFYLMNNIDMQNTAIQSIGKAIGGPFTGVFHGQGFELQNVDIQENASDVGLFTTVGDTSRAGQIRNLTINGGTVSGDQYVGAIAGTVVHGSVTGCTVTGINISSAGITAGDGRQRSRSGGMVGRLANGQPAERVRINDCAVSSTTVTAAGWYAGGVVGTSYGDIVGCDVTDVTVDINNTNIGGGGVVGEAYESVSDCTADLVTVTLEQSGFFATTQGICAGAIIGDHLAWSEGRTGVELTNLTVTSPNITGDRNVGGAIGRALGEGMTIQNISVDGGTVEALAGAAGNLGYAGGVIGQSGNADATSSYTYSIQGCTVTNTTIAGTGRYYGGVIGIAGEGGSIDTLEADNVTVETPAREAGGAIGACFDVARNITVTGSTIGIQGSTNQSGGAMGRMGGDGSANSGVFGDVADVLVQNTTVFGAVETGGVVGTLEDEVNEPSETVLRQAVADGVKVIGTQAVGGVVGRSGGLIEGVAVKNGEVDAQEYLAGVVGWNATIGSLGGGGVLRRAYAFADLSFDTAVTIAAETRIGGVVAANQAVSNSTAQEGLVEDVYFDGRIDETSTSTLRIGGVVGANYFDDGNGTIATGTLVDGYWLSDITSPPPAGVGIDRNQNVEPPDEPGVHTEIAVNSDMIGSSAETTMSALPFGTNTLDFTTVTGESPVLNFELEGNLTLAVGGSTGTSNINVSESVSATVTDETGTDVTASSTITTSDASIVDVSGSTVTGVAEGSATVTASYNGSTSSVTVEVGEFAESIQLSTGTTTLNAGIGETTSYTVTETTNLGNTTDVTSSASVTSSNTAAVTVDSTGATLEGVGSGDSTITASFEGTTDSVVVTAFTESVLTVDVDDTSGAAVTSATVNVTAVSDGTTTSQAVDASGIASFTLADGDDYTVETTATGFQTDTRTITLTADTTEVVVLNQLQPIATILGTAVGGGNKPSATIDWEAESEIGALSSVLIETVVSADGTVVDSTTVTVSGSTASGSATLNAYQNGNNPDPDIARVTVTDTDNRADVVTSPL